MIFARKKKFKNWTEIGKRQLHVNTGRKCSFLRVEILSAFILVLVPISAKFVTRSKNDTLVHETKVDRPDGLKTH